MRLRSLVSALAFTVAAGASVILLADPVNAQSTDGGVGTPNTVDEQFVKQAIKSGDMEIDQAQAELKSNPGNPSVSLFAHTMIRDHSAANAQIAAVASNLNIPYPQSHIETATSTSNGTPPPAAMGADKATAMPPRSYMQQEVADHQKAIALFESEVKNGGSQQLRTAAAQALPTLKAHLAMAQQYMNTGMVTPEVTPTPVGATGP